MNEKDRNFTMYLQDMVDTIHRIEHFVSGMEYPAFQQDEKTRFATIQAIEIIGEAA